MSHEHFIQPYMWRWVREKKKQRKRRQLWEDKSRAGHENGLIFGDYQLPPKINKFFDSL
jgi:hypothetical protein